MPLLVGLAVSCAELACGAFSGSSDDDAKSTPPADADAAPSPDAAPLADAASADTSPDAPPSCPGFPTNGSAYRAAVVADCPVAYFPLEEAAGAKAAVSAVDKTSTPINGGSTPGYTFGVAGFVGTAVDFTGKNEGFAFVFPFAVDAGARFTLEAWVRPKTNVGTLPAFLDADASGQGFTVDVLPGQYDLGARFSVARNGTKIAAETSVPLPAGNVQDYGWHHLAVVADGAAYRIYLDGVEGTVASTLPLTKTGLPLSFGNFFTGSFDEVAIYDRPLAKDRILAHYTAR